MHIILNNDVRLPSHAKQSHLKMETSLGCVTCPFPLPTFASFRMLINWLCAENELSLGLSAKKGSPELS